MKLYEYFKRQYMLKVEAKGATERFQLCLGEIGKLRFRLRQAEGETRGLAAEIAVKRSELYDAVEHLEGISVETYALEVARQAGLGYERSWSGRWMGTHMPPVPPETMTVFWSDVQHPRVRFKVVLSSIAMFVVAVLWALAQVAYMPPANTYGAWLLLILLPTQISVLGVGVGGVLLYRALYDKSLTNVLLARQQDFMSGAEVWTAAQRLTSCIIYATRSWWVILAPLLVVPMRFAQVFVYMAYYLRSVRKHEQVEASVRTTQFMTLVGRWVRAALGVGLILVGIA